MIYMLLAPSQKLLAHVRAIDVVNMFSNYYCLLRLNLPQPRLPPSSEIASSQSRDNSQKNKSTRRFPKPVTRVARKDDVDKCQELMWSFFSHINFFSFLKDDMPFG